MKKIDFIFIILLFYAGWFGSVFLARTDFSLVSLIFPFALVGFLFFRKNLNVQGLKLALGISVAGILFDFLLIHFGFISAIAEPVLLIPIWLISIWLLFSFSMIKLGPQLKPALWLAVLLGGIMGPLSYKSGEYFQVLSFSSAQTFWIYSIFWALMFPLVLNLSKRLV